MRLWTSQISAKGIGSLGKTRCKLISNRSRLATIRPLTSSPSPRRRAPVSRCISFQHTPYSSLSFYDDTIYALSTAPGRAGIAIVRISGPAVPEIHHKLCPSKPLPTPREATLRNLRDPISNILLDSALVLHFPAPNTVTGEAVLELHIHGGPATVKAVLAAIPKCSSSNISSLIRYAEPGEFTRRAFQNNRLSLDQVEALSSALAAETEQQRRAAVRGSSGKLGRTYETWRQLLLYARGELEALIDFSEDQHFDESPTELISNVTAQIKTMLEAMNRHEVAGQRGELLRKGIRIALIGPPNAGKSSLLNRLVGREASIVSQEAGTTRDVVEVSLDIRGYLCTFADTAGLRTDGAAVQNGEGVVIGAVEKEGIKRARAKASEADLIIALASLEPSSGPERYSISYDHESLSVLTTKPSLIVINKCDVLSLDTNTIPTKNWQNITQELHSHIKITSEHAPPPLIPISCLQANDPNPSTNDPGNINHLTTSLVHLFDSMTSLPPDEADLVGVTERQRQLLRSCSTHLREFLRLAEGKDSGEREGEVDIVIAAECLREAANCLARITGRGGAGDVEEVLGVVFERFCVGK